MIFTKEEVNQFRHDTPGCAYKVHLNNAGASLMPQPVVDAVTRHIQLEAVSGGYEAAALMDVEIQTFYYSAARLLHCKPENIAFTANATDSFFRAISSVPFKPTDVLLTSNEDYISNQITYLAFAKRFGIKVVRVNSNPAGGIDLEDFEKCMVKYSPRLVSITHIPTNSGLIQPVALIGEICKKYETVYLIDACQSIGQLELNVQDLNCDFLSVTSRKFLRGPRGAGFLYVSDKALNLGLEPLSIDMRGADWVDKDRYVPRDGAIRFEDWEFAYALLLGTGAAIDYLLKLDIDKIHAQLNYLSSYLRSELLKIKGVSVYDRGSELGSLVTFHMQGQNPDHIKDELAKKNINVVTSIRNFAVIDYDAKNIAWTIRASPHYFNTIDEIDLLIEGIKELNRKRINS